MQFLVTSSFLVGGIAAFTSVTHPIHRCHERQMPTAFHMTSTLMENKDVASSEEPLMKAPKAKVMSQSIPFLECPDVLVHSDLAGNAGFDPLSLATSEDQLLSYREAEIKHGRLAMIAAVALPTSELLDKRLIEYGDESALDDVAETIPSFIAGGLEKLSPEFWGACLGMTAALDLYGARKAESHDSTYFPGNYGCDPLHLYPSDSVGQKQMQLAEIKHGRLAMIAVVGFASQESVSEIGVLNETPAFLTMTETASQFLQGLAA